MPADVQNKAESGVSRRKAKTRQKKNTPQDTPPANDHMSRCVELCQQNRWREATLLCLQVASKGKDGKTGVASGLSAAQPKIEYSLKRQMAAAVVRATRELLAKEFLLDV
jgi:hypothetical protein